MRHTTASTSISPRVLPGPARGRRSRRAAAGILSATLVAAIAGCATPAPPSPLVAFTTQLRSANQVPVNRSTATGSVDAVLNKETNLFRWKVIYTGLSGPATAGHFHGPAAIGVNAGVALPWAMPLRPAMDGRATLTPAQASDLLAGRWYANIHTAAYPGGEIRGQMTVRN